MTQRSLFRSLAVGVIILLLLGITGCTQLFDKGAGTYVSPAKQPEATIFISQQTPVMVSMLVNSERWQVIQSQKDLSKFPIRLLSDIGIDYQQDIQPWLGNEITLAVTTLDIDRNPENGQQPGYLMVLTTEQPDKSREFIEWLFSKQILAGATLAVEKYQGVKLIYTNQDSSTLLEQSQDKSLAHLAGATVGKNFVLLANDPKVLRDAINNVQAPNLNLNSFDRYQQAVKLLPTEALGLVFLNLPLVAKWQGLEPKVQTYDSQLTSLILNSPQGLQVQTALFTQEKVLPHPAELSQPAEVLTYIPTSASLVVAGSDLSHLNSSSLALLWTQISTAIFGSEGDSLGKWIQPLGNFQKRWGISWQDDIFNWVEGEYAIGLIPREQKTLPDWIFVVEKSAATPKGIAHLDEIAATHGLSVSPITFDNQQLSTWIDLTTIAKQSTTREQGSFDIQAKALGIHTTRGNYEIFASSLEAIAAALAQDSALIDDSDFQKSIAVLPQANQGFVYLDWQKDQGMIESQLPILKLVEILGKPWLENLRSLTISSYGSEAGLLKGGVFFQFYTR